MYVEPYHKYICSSTNGGDYTTSMLICECSVLYNQAARVLQEMETASEACMTINAQISMDEKVTYTQKRRSKIRTGGERDTL
jgi:hypothetical protein